MTQAIVPVANTWTRFFVGTVKEEIFVGEKFRTFRSKTFRMEFNFVLKLTKESEN